MSNEKKFHTAQSKKTLDSDQKLGKIMQTAITPSIEAFQKKMQQTFQAQSINFEIPRIDPIHIHSFAMQIEGFKSTIEGLSEGLRISFRNLPPELKKSLTLLGDHGWFLDDDMDIPWLWRVKTLLMDRCLADAEKLLVSHFERRVDAIENSIIERFPSRGTLIHSAFKAHRRQEYELSIPVLLAQADGICHEVSSKYLYNKERRNREPQMASYIRDIATSKFSEAILCPFAQDLPINKSEKDRGENFSGLNRHMVLHGESLDYGNNVNGLKAISLINYVAYTLKDTAKNKVGDIT